MATYVNRTYDSVAGAFVRWSTAAADTVGALYPGPGVFGATATDYCVEDILNASVAIADFRNDFITGETVTGTDSLLSTSLSAAPSDGQSILIIYNRQALSQGQDFTVAGTAITWLASTGTAPDLIASDTLFIYYVVDSIAATIDFLNDFITGETVTGTDSVLSGALSSPPSDPESVICAYNRQILSQGQDFAISGTAITWLASAGTAPDLVPGDTLQFYYVVNTTGASTTDSDAIHDNVASEIAVITEKVAPIAADLVIIEDSADSNNKKRAQLGNLPSTDADAIHDNVAGEIAAIAAGTVASGDLLVMEDIDDSNNKKRVTAQSIADLSGGGSFTWIATRTTAGAAVSAFDIVPLDPVSVGPFTVLLPAAPVSGDIVILVNITVSSNTITVSGNGNNINLAASYAISASQEEIQVSYNGTEWFIVG